jgi:hypothetical protein
MGFKNKLKQKCVCWGTPSLVGNGEKTYPDPVELSCRWEDRSQLVRNKDGQEVMSKSTVYLGEAVALDSFLFLSTLADLPDGATPLSVKTARKLLALDSIPNTANTETIYIGYLS